MPDEAPSLPEFVSWPTFPFEGDIRVKPLDPPVAEEPPRQGEDPSTCTTCSAPDDAYIWVAARWRVRALDRPTGLPMVLILESRSHLDLGDLPNLLAAELGVMVVRLERAIRSLDGVARVHVNRWGDGSAHLHLWFLARPFGRLQLRGTFLSLWDDILPPIPEDEWRNNLALVAAWLADFGGRAVAAPSRIDWKSFSTLAEEGADLELSLAQPPSADAPSDDPPESLPLLDADHAATDTTEPSGTEQVAPGLSERGSSGAEPGAAESEGAGPDATAVAAGAGAPDADPAAPAVLDEWSIPGAEPVEVAPPEPPKAKPRAPRKRTPKKAAASPPPEAPGAGAVDEAPAQAGREGGAAAAPDSASELESASKAPADVQAPRAASASAEGEPAAREPAAGVAAVAGSAAGKPAAGDSPPKAPVPADSDPSERGAHEPSEPSERGERGDQGPSERGVHDRGNHREPSERGGGDPAERGEQDPNERGDGDPNERSGAGPADGAGSGQGAAPDEERTAPDEEGPAARAPSHAP